MAPDLGRYARPTCGRDIPASTVAVNRLLGRQNGVFFSTILMAVASMQFLRKRLNSIPSKKVIEKLGQKMHFPNGR